LPKVGNYAGNGAHSHISLWKNGFNIIGEAGNNYGLSKEGESFIAGILKNLNILSFLFSPSPNSFRRRVPSRVVGYYKFWSIENKEAPIRIVNGSSKMEEVSNFELKVPDHTANHYFAFAAAIMYGL